MQTRARARHYSALMAAYSGTRSRAGRRCRVTVTVALAWLGYGSACLAQAPVCLPGTTICAASDERGGVQVNANGSAQASPNGASASGQANGNANANANASGSGQATGEGQYSDGGGGGHYRGYRGRFGTGVTLCPIVRIGVWSGLKAGGCVAVSFRFESLTFEMESQLLYGGSTHAFDWTFPMSFLIPLANADSLYEGPYLRFGGSPVGATFARKKDGGSFVRFGLFAGAGYELDVAKWLTWRVFDARFSFDMGTRRAMDDREHWVDLGFQLGTGLVL
jgi:hypothetical protein